MKSATMGVMACLAIGISSAGWAQDLKVTQKLTDTQIGFNLDGTYSNYSLTISGPNGFHAIAASRTDVPSIDLRLYGEYDDGVYHYQLIAASGETVPVRTALDNGREGRPANAMTKGVTT